MFNFFLAFFILTINHITIASDHSIFDAQEDDLLIVEDLQNYELEEELSSDQDISDQDINELSNDVITDNIENTINETIDLEDAIINDINDIDERYGIDSYENQQDIIDDITTSIPLEEYDNDHELLDENLEDAMTSHDFEEDEIEIDEIDIMEQQSEEIEHKLLKLESSITNLIEQDKSFQIYLYGTVGGASFVFYNQYSRYICQDIDTTQGTVNAFPFSISISNPLNNSTAIEIEQPDNSTVIEIEQPESVNKPYGFAALGIQIKIHRIIFSVEPLTYSGAWVLFSDHNKIFDYSSFKQLPFCLGFQFYSNNKIDLYCMVNNMSFGTPKQDIYVQDRQLNSRFIRLSNVPSLQVGFYSKIKVTHSISIGAQIAMPILGLLSNKHNDLKLDIDRYKLTSFKIQLELRIH